MASTYTAGDVTSLHKIHQRLPVIFKIKFRLLSQYRLSWLLPMSKGKASVPNTHAISPLCIWTCSSPCPNCCPQPT
jgi:hypothetical protein